MKNQKVFGIIAMALVALFWGLSFYSIQVIGTTIGPFTLATARFAIAAIAFYYYLLYYQQKEWSF